jgi:hypothetical protein
MGGDELTQVSDNTWVHQGMARYLVSKFQVYTSVSSKQNTDVSDLVRI